MQLILSFLVPREWGSNLVYTCCVCVSMYVSRSPGAVVGDISIVICCKRFGSATQSLRSVVCRARELSRTNTRTCLPSPFPAVCHGHSLNLSASVVWLGSKTLQARIYNFNLNLVA